MLGNYRQPKTHQTPSDASGVLGVGQGFGNGNQLVSLTHHGFILPCPSDKTTGLRSREAVTG